MASREHRRMIQRKKAGDKTHAERQKQRHPVFYWITFVVLIVVVVAFIGTGVVGGVTQRKRLVFGKYGKNEIELLRGGYSGLNFFTAQIDNFSSQTQNQEQVPNLWRDAFDNAITHYAILELVEKSGYVVSKKRLDRRVANHSDFQTDGRFDEKKYKDTSDMEKSLIKKLINEEIIHTQFIDDVLFSQLISSSEVGFYKEMKGVERRFSYISYRYSDFPQEKVTLYGNENKELFKQMRLSRILLTDSSLNEAEDIRAEVENKVKSFEEIAKEKSKDIYAEKGGDMSNQYFYQVLGFLENEEDVRHIFSLKKDELSRVVQNGENFEIYKCNSIVTEPDFSDDSLLRTVRDYMMKYQKDVIEEFSIELAKTFKQKADEVGFEQACKELDKEPPYETEFFPINYLDVFPSKGIRSTSGEAPSIISASGSEDFFITAFSLNQDEVSGPVMLDDQAVVLKFLEEKVMSEDDWELENVMFKTSLSNFQNDYTMMQLVNSIYQITAKHYQQPQVVYQYLFSNLLALAEEKNIPYEYAFKVFLNINNDLEIMIEDIKQNKVEDNFDETFRSLFTQG